MRRSLRDAAAVHARLVAAEATIDRLRDRVPTIPLTCVWCREPADASPCRCDRQWNYFVAALLGAALMAGLLYVAGALRT